MNEYKYLIKFDFDLSDVLDKQDDDCNIEILELNDECFDKVISDSNDIKEFEDWYNDGVEQNEQISVKDISYERQDDYVGGITIILNNELAGDKETFAKAVVEYFFETDWPTVEYNASGTTYEDYWDYARSSPEQRDVKFDYNDSESISSYDNVTITNVN